MIFDSSSANRWSNRNAIITFWALMAILIIYLSVIRLNFGKKNNRRLKIEVFLRYSEFNKNQEISKLSFVIVCCLSHWHFDSKKKNKFWDEFDRWKIFNIFFRLSAKQNSIFSKFIFHQIIIDADDPIEFTKFYWWKAQHLVHKSSSSVNCHSASNCVHLSRNFPNFVVISKLMERLTFAIAIFHIPSNCYKY